MIFLNFIDLSQETNRRKRKKPDRPLRSHSENGDSDNNDNESNNSNTINTEGGTGSDDPGKFTLMNPEHHNFFTYFYVYSKVKFVLAF